jgi:hypothetical protein
MGVGFRHASAQPICLKSKEVFLRHAGSMPAWSHTAAFKFAPIEGKARRSCVNACLLYGYGICLGAVASEPLRPPSQIAFADYAA